MAEESGRQTGRSMRCRVGVHRYQPTTNDSGDRYLVCERCGKEEFPEWSLGRGADMV